MTPDDILKSKLKRDLPEAPDNPFLEQRIWNAIQSDATPRRGGIRWLTFSHLTAGLGALSALFLITLNRTWQTTDSPLVAASPTFSVEEEIFETLVDLPSDPDESEEFAEFYEMI